MSEQPLKLYAVADRKALTAFQAGRGMLSSALAYYGDDEPADSPRLSVDPYPPCFRKQTIVELTFEDPGALVQFSMQILDAPPTYELPESILQSGRLRVLTDVEIMEVARQTLEIISPPGFEPLWKIMEQFPPRSRRREFGPWLCEAFEERGGRKA